LDGLIIKKQETRLKRKVKKRNKQTYNEKQTKTLVKLEDKNEELKKMKIRFKIVWFRKNSKLRNFNLFSFLLFLFS